MIYEIYESIVESLIGIKKQISEHKKKSRPHGSIPIQEHLTTIDY